MYQLRPILRALNASPTAANAAAQRCVMTHRLRIGRACRIDTPVQPSSTPGLAAVPHGGHLLLSLQCARVLSR